MITNIPRDIIESLCTNYLHPQDALALLTTTKQFYKCLTPTLLNNMKERYAIKVIRECDICEHLGYLWTGGFKGGQNNWKVLYCKKCDRHVLSLPTKFNLMKSSLSRSSYEINGKKNSYIRSHDYLINCGLSLVAPPGDSVSCFVSCVHDIETRNIVLENHLWHQSYFRRMQSFDSVVDITDLPKDIIELLCLVYLAPEDALAFLSTSKKLRKHLTSVILNNLKTNFTRKLIKECNECRRSELRCSDFESYLVSQFTSREMDDPLFRDSVLKTHKHHIKNHKQKRNLTEREPFPWFWLGVLLVSVYVLHKEFSSN
jgi:hypothetical protein